MQVVIDIPDEWKTRIEYNRRPSTIECGQLIESIWRGKILPKSHGRLIDADEALEAMNTYDKYGYLPHDLIRLTSENGLNLIPYVHYDDMVTCITNMSTIIEADKEEEENE